MYAKRLCYDNVIKLHERKTAAMNKAFKYRLYPTKEQAALFNNTFGCCRKVWNLMLADKLVSYKETGKFVSVTPARYKSEYPFLKDVDSLALSNVQLNLQRAFRDCFSKTRKKNTGFPKFKSAKHSRRSYTTNNQNGTVAISDDRHIRLPKLGKVRAVIHRHPDASWNIKSATVSQDGDGRYYVSVLFEYDVVIPVCKPDMTKVIGMDYASDGLYVDDTGVRGTEHKYYRESQKRLAKAQRRLSRMTGSGKHEAKSANYLKQLRKVNKIHKHVSNQRLDHLHKRSTEIANRYDAVCVEDLNMKAQSNKSFGNGKATMDNGYGMFQSMLSYKLADRGKRLVRVDKWYPSSQICHCCGKRHPEMKDLKIRIMRCDCGNVMDRDQNAAINIRNEGIRILMSSVA